MNISEEQKRQYREEGYFLIERGLSSDQLALLRKYCDGLMAEADAAMDARGVSTDGINVRGNRYFITMSHQSHPELLSFLTSDTMMDICRATLGDNAYLVWEQYVVKAAERGKSFGWHQDSSYAEHDGIDFSPGVSCWCPLDDVDEDNGTIYILPYAKAGGNKIVPHVRDAQLNDLVGYHGDEPGIPVILAAGGIAVFSHLVFHRSGPNTTDRMRRVYLPQYAVAPKRDRKTGLVSGYNRPVLQGGCEVGNASYSESP